MKSSASAVSILAFAASVSVAQTDSLDGKWSGQMAAANGVPIRVDISVSKATGNVRLSPVSGASPVDNHDTCHFRDIPVDIATRSATELNFVVRGDKVLRGCFKGAGVLKLVDGKSATGTMKDGRSFTLTRR